MSVICVSFHINNSYIGDYIGLSMKYLLIMILCPNVSGTCLPGYEWPVQYDNLYECLETGYRESLRKHQDIGKSEINEHGMYIKFNCREINTI